MDRATLSARLAELTAELAGFSGHRTVWIDLSGALVHAEPDEPLEDRGFLYVGTFFRPRAEALAEAVARRIPTAAAPARAFHGDPDVGPVALAPA